MLSLMPALRLTTLALPTLALSLALACGGEGASSASATEDSEGSTDASASEATTGGPEWCQGWQGSDGPASLELHNDGKLLVDGGTLALQCSAQNTLMFGLYPTFAGITPVKDTVYFDLIVDVPGHNTDSDDHFYSTVYSYYVGCEPREGIALGVIPVFPPGMDADIAELDGLTANLHIAMRSGSDLVELDLALELAVDVGGPLAFCGQG